MASLHLGKSSPAIAYSLSAAADAGYLALSGLALRACVLKTHPKAQKLS